MQGYSLEAFYQNMPILILKPISKWLKLMKGWTDAEYVMKVTNIICDHFFVISLLGSLYHKNLAYLAK